MPEILWDASALAKAYIPETGTPIVEALFRSRGSVPHTSTYLGYAETAAILRRRRNQESLSDAEFTAARIRLREDMLHSTDLSLLSIGDADVLAGVALSDRHNINSTDATILAVFLEYSRLRLPDLPACLLVASDQRLLRAAAAEGLDVFNPESATGADVATLLSSA